MCQKDKREGRNQAIKRGTRGRANKVGRMASILSNVSDGLYCDNRLHLELTACCKLFLALFIF